MSKSTQRSPDRARAISYTRQSMLREESISLEMQDRANREHAQRHGYIVIETVEDPGVSGLQFAKRPGIRRAIEGVETGDADVIVVWRWSRLSRKRPHQAVILEQVERAGGRVESATEPVDATTAGGRFTREVLLAAAAYDSEMKSEQWREAQVRRVRQLSLPPGGQAPFGYTRKLDAAGKPMRDAPLVPHPEHADVVREMYAMYLRGVGPQKIAKWLNDQGITTQPRQRRGESKPTGRPFSVNAVSRLLDSGFAVGLIQVHDPECPMGRRPDDGHIRQCGRRVKLPGAHEPLIDQATWETYQRERDRRRGVRPKARQPRWFLGGGLTICGRCGGSLAVQSYTAPKSLARCTTYANSRTCDGVWIDRVRLETVVGLWLGSRVEELADHQDAIRGVDDERDHLTKETDEARVEEEKVRGGLRALRRLVSSGDLSDDEYRDEKRVADERLQGIAAKITDIQTRLDALAPDADVYERLTRGLVYAAPLFGDGENPDDFPPTATRADGSVTSPEEHGALIRKVVRRVVVDPQTITIEPWRGEPHTYDRNVVAPRQPRRDGAPARGSNGRFIARTATAKSTRTTD